MVKTCDDCDINCIPNNFTIRARFLFQEIKESHVLRSSLNVETKVNNGVPEKVSAAEEYLYKPFSVGENGARARVHTKLTLTGKGGGGGANGKLHYDPT